MQSRYHDGSYGSIKPFSHEEMSKELNNPDVEHVEVFEATEEQIKYRQKLFSGRKKYQKAKPTKLTSLNLQIKITEKRKR